jgi:hypothetical protein
VSTKDVNTAKEILAYIPMDEIPEFLDYSLAAATKTNYPVQTLGGIRRYLADYLQSRERRAAAKAAAAASQAEQRETQARLDYDQFRRGQLDAIFKTLSPEERESIECLARAKALPAGRKEGFLTRTFVEMERTRIMAERYGDHVQSFEHWRTGHVA